MRKKSNFSTREYEGTLRVHFGAWLRRLSPILAVGCLLLLWQWIGERELISHILVPPPRAVYRAFIDALADGTLSKHAFVTLEEMLYGLLLGVGIGLAIGYAIAKLPLLEYILAPIIVGFQSTPIVAYAPLLVIWFGSGPTSKVVTTAVIVFFPTLMNTIVGIREVSPNLRDMMRSLKAGRWQTFRHLEAPSALPVVLAGLKTSATLAVIGAVVGEFVSQGSGLGYLVTSARNLYDTPLVIVAVLSMTAISLSLYGLVGFVEWRFLVWQRRSGL
jgi:NitT/TauT family transport system permease protein